MERLEHFSDRSLNLFASMLLGREARVFVADRLTRPLVVALESDSVGLRPGAAHLYDLCLGARLLRRRAEGKRWHQEKGRIPQGAVAAWVREESHQLQQEFPRITELPGHHHPRRSTRPPEVVWRDVPFAKLDWSRDRVVQAAARLAPGLSFENIDDDFPGLLQAIRDGRYSLEQLPDFPLPVATVPVAVTVSQAYPAELEQLEESLNRNRHMEQVFIDCYTQKSEGLLDLALDPARFTAGVRLDHTRLAEAVVARTRGAPPRLFRNKDRDHHPVFQPDEHLAVHAVDINAVFESGYGQRRWSGHQVAFLTRILQKLDVDFALIGFADRVVEVGQPAYLHLPVTVKEVDDPFNGACYSRLAHVFLRRALGNLPGEPAAYHPLHLRTVEALFRREQERRGHAFHCLIWAAPQGMPRSLGQFHSPEYWQATSARVDERFDAWKREFPGARWDNDFLFLPHEMKRAARPGGSVAGAQGW